jgi:hypothetical protein
MFGVTMSSMQALHEARVQMPSSFTNGGHEHDEMTNT